MDVNWKASCRLDDRHRLSIGHLISPSCLPWTSCVKRNVMATRSCSSEGLSVLRMSTGDIIVLGWAAGI